LTSKRFGTVISILSLLIFTRVMTAQAPAPAAGPATAQVTNASSGTYSIEGEILTYKALEVNSQNIAQDVASVPGDKPTGGVVVVPSASTILPSFQLWRANMLVTQSFIDQADRALKPVGQQSADGGPCLALLTPPTGSAASFSGYATGVTQGVGVIQTILSLFSSGQSAAGLQGTVQDQALMIAVSRELTKQKINVLAPDIFTSWTIDSTLPYDKTNAKDQSPFIKNLKTLIDRLYSLQNAYQCDQLIINTGTQLTTVESAREADFAKLQSAREAELPKTGGASKPGAAPKPGAKSTAITKDILSLTSQIWALRTKIGLDMGNDSVEAKAEKQIKADLQTLNGNDSSQWADAVQDVTAQDGNVQSVEIKISIEASLAGPEAQSVVSGISGYLAGLTGGAVTVASPAPSGTTTPQGTTPAPTTPAPGGAPAAPAGGANPASPPANAGAPTAPGGSTPAPAAQTASPSPSSTPPIVTVLQADGFARKMGVLLDDKGKWPYDDWRILFVKSTESGTTIETKSRFLSTSLLLDGGAVSGYALFKLDGTLLCSGNAAAYQGNLSMQAFSKLDAKTLIATPLIIPSGGCKPPEAAAGNNQQAPSSPASDDGGKKQKKKQ
jgi:hypothetical protein